MQVAIFLQRELVPPHGLELGTVVEPLAGGNVAFLDGEVHHRAEDRHLEADGGVADESHRAALGRRGRRRNGPTLTDSHGLQRPAARGRIARVQLRGLLGGDFAHAVAPVAAGAVLAPPGRIASPHLVTDQVDLDGTDIIFQGAFKHRLELLWALGADLPAPGPRLLGRQVFLGHSAEGMVEHRHVVLEAEAHVSVLVEGALTGRLLIRRLQRDRLVAVGLRQLHAAVPVAVLYVGTPEDDESRLQLFLVVDKRHMPHSFCVGSVQIGGVSP